MKKVLIFLIVGSSFLFSQSYDKQSAYFSANFGLYKSGDNSDFRNLGSQRIGGGIGLGFRISGNLFFYARGQYVAKSNFTGYYDNTYLNTDLSLVSTIGTANASMSQLVLNSGLQYNIFLTRDLSVGFLGGVTYTMVDQEARSFSGVLLNRIANEWFYGYFGGATLEKRFKNSNLTVFAEGIYNYIDDQSVFFRDLLSGMNFTVGGRYYLAD